MKKPRLFLLLLLAVAAGFMLSHYALAQLPRPASSAGNEAMRRYERLVTDLAARGDTNTLKQVISLLAAKDTLGNTKDVNVTVALLQRLRAGRTNEVIGVLETTLDGALISLAASPQEIGEPQTEAIKLARQYRAKYPRKEDASVTRAFELLDKR